MRRAPAANANNNNKQTGIDGKRLLSGLIAHHLDDLTVAVNKRERRGTGCWLHSREDAGRGTLTPKSRTTHSSSTEAVDGSEHIF